MHKAINFFNTEVLSICKVVPLILIFVYANTLFAQTFEKIYRTNDDDCSYEAIEVSNEYFIAVNTGNYYNFNYQGKILKVNKYGKILDSLYIPIHNGFISSDIWKLINISDTLFLCIAIERNSSGNLFMQYVHFTKDLLITFDTVINDAPNLSYLDFSVNDDFQIVSVGYITEYQEQFIKICDIYGNLIGYKTYIGEYGPLASTIIDIPKRNKYHMFIYLSNESCFFEIDKETLSLDTILHYPDYFWPRNAIKGINDSSYYIIGTQNVLLNNGIRKLSFIEMSIYGDTIKQNSYLVSPDKNSFYSYNSFSIYNEKIYFGGTYNFTLTPQFPFFNEHRWVFINKLNPDGSIIWQRFYKGDANYVPYKVLATTDGGALILSTKYDWNDPVPYQRDLHILKVDSTGWYDELTTTDTEHGMPKQILVYPNPAKDNVTFVTGFYNNLELSIYNLQGEPVLKQKLPYTQTIDISALPNGLYVYIITGKNGFNEKGKLFIAH